MEKITINGNWDIFSKFVIPKNAPKLQKSAMEKSFYAGATVVLGILSDLSDLKEAEAILIWQKLKNEVQDFVELEVKDE